jgi:hypothetical protein
VQYSLDIIVRRRPPADCRHDARGIFAIEIGFARLAEMQEEIL